MDSRRKNLRSDLEELLGRFKKTGSVRFELFSQIWKEMKFDQIFYGISGHERRVFTQLALDETALFFFPPFSFQIRVGGLYLLHCLYHCQTSSPPLQIRVALKDWWHAERFERDAVEAHHLDVVFILRRLRFLRAFHFCSMPMLLTFQKKTQPLPSRFCEDFVEPTSRPQELVGAELLEEISNIHGLYEKAKASAYHSAGVQDPGTNLIRKDLLPQLRAAVMDFYLWQERKRGEEEDAGEGTSLQQSTMRADLLSSIKSKAYQLPLEAPRSRRHRQVESEAATSAPVHIATRRQPRKRSLKARTQENLCLTEDPQTERKDSLEAEAQQTEEETAKTSATVIRCLTTLELPPGDGD